jgi:hypothetical protein
MHKHDWQNLLKSARFFSLLFFPNIEGCQFTQGFALFDPVKKETKAAKA